MNNNKKLIVATLAGIALCCTTLAAPGPRGGRHGGHGGRDSARMHQAQRYAPQTHRAHRPPPVATHHHHHHDHHRDGLGLAAGIVNLVSDILAPAPVVIQQPTVVQTTTPVLYQTPATTVYTPATTVYTGVPSTYQGW